MQKSQQTHWTWTWSLATTETIFTPFVFACLLFSLAADVCFVLGNITFRPSMMSVLKIIRTQMQRTKKKGQKNDRTNIVRYLSENAICMSTTRFFFLSPCPSRSQLPPCVAEALEIVRMTLFTRSFCHRVRHVLPPALAWSLHAVASHSSQTHGKSTTHHAQTKSENA